MPETLTFDKNLYDLLDTICSQYEQGKRSEMAVVKVDEQRNDLGNFDPIWQYLSEASKPVLCIPPSEVLGGSDHGGESSVDLKRQKQRDARRSKRRLAHELCEEDSAVPAFDDVPDLGQYTSTSDLDNCITSSEDESTIVGRLDRLRSTLESATADFHRSPGSIAKRLVMSDKDRVVSTRQKLAKAFPEESQFSQSSGSQNIPKVAFVEKTGNILSSDSQPICKTHIFIDSSNIYLGFQDLLQKSYPACYPAFSHRKPVMDVHVLDSILERGRQSERKFVVASSPLLQNWEPVCSRDYQLSILERVPTQGNPNHLKEQGVDELLHLQMMESILDFQPGTMVLASGDANTAQFSSGFYQVVARALCRGWRVEIVGFRKSMNRLWLDSNLRQEHENRCRVIFLDDYLRELEM